MAKLLIAILFASATLATTASAQVIVEEGILAPKTKAKDPLSDKWDKAMKEPNGTKPAAKPATKSGATTAATAPAKPKVLPETFSGETEDPMAILGIDPDVLTRFSSALSAETTQRTKDASMKAAQYDAVGATAGGFTPRQYFVLKARVRSFCEAIAAGQAPSDNLTLSYMPSEAASIKPRCGALLPLLKLTPVIPLGK